MTISQAAAIYTRISQDTEDEGLGVARQEQDCRRVAERLGWSVAMVYAENDTSATRAKARPLYSQLIADIEAGVIDAVVFWDSDRLTRTPSEGEKILELVEQRGLLIANSYGEEDLSTPDGKYIFRINVAAARRETDKMSRRLKRKFEQKAGMGEPHGRVPYGYRVEGVKGRPHGKRDIENPAQGAVIREAAERVLAGQSLRSVAMDFTARGIPGPTGGAWSSTILRQILKRPTLAGLRQYRGEVLGKSDSIDAIITEETHERLVRLLSDPSRRTNTAGSDNRYLLSGIATCGREGCGGKMRRSVGRVENGHRQPPSYSCNTCYRVRRKEEDVDFVVVGKVIARLMGKDAIKLFQTGDPLAEAQARTEIAALEKKLAEYDEDREEDRMTREQHLRLTAKTRAKLEQAKARRRAALPTILAPFDFTDVQGSWEKKTIEQQRELLMAMGTTVTIQPSGSGRRFDPELIEVSFRNAA